MTKWQCFETVLIFTVAYYLTSKVAQQVSSDDIADWLSTLI